MKDKLLKVLSSFTKPSTWTMAILTTFMYSLNLHVSIGLENRPTPYEREGFLGVQILALLCIVTYVSLGFENRPTP